MKWLNLLELWSLYEPCILDRGLHLEGEILCELMQVITHSLLSTSVVIEEDYLGVGWIFDFMPSCIVAWWVELWVDVDNLSISSISEKKSLFRACIGLEVWWVVMTGSLGIPMEVAQISVLWQQLLIAWEIVLEVLGLHAVCQVDISTDFILSLDVSDEENCGQSAVS